jgi:LysM repeat protein
MHQAPVSRRRRAARIALGIVTIAALTLSGTAGYTVRAGDTLSSIANRHGVSISALVSANNIVNPNLIRTGQTLRIPSSPSGGVTATAAGVHMVRAGETLMGISIRYGVKMSAIAAANGMSSLNLVYAGQRLRIPGSASAVAPAAGPTVSRAHVGTLLEQTAQRYGFAPRFVKAIAMQESGWNQAARSSVGAVGVMQVLPSTGDFISRYIVGRPLNLANTQDNITAGVAFLKYLWDLTGGNVRMTLAGYYQGLASVRDRGMYASTKQYIANILALRERFA